jgi:hypothetical protein
MAKMNVKSGGSLTPHSHSYIYVCLLVGCPTGLWVSYWGVLPVAVGIS